MSAEPLREAWGRLKDAARQAAQEASKAATSHDPAARYRSSSLGWQRGRAVLPPDAVISWQDAERLAAWHMQQLGFHDARVTSSGQDWGVDVHAEGAVAQVKFHEAKTGRPDVQALHGAATAGKAAALFCATGYTPQAIAYADATDIALFTFSDLGDVVPVARAAHALARRSTSSQPRLGVLGRARAAGYRARAGQLMAELEKLTAKTDKRTQSRSSAKRAAAGVAAEALLVAGRALDGMEMLAPQDRRRDDVLRGATQAIALARKNL